jgi:hypothetical protein
MKKIKTTRKLNLKLDTLRTLERNELRRVDGGITDSVVLQCVNQLTAASSGPVCCA